MPSPVGHALAGVLTAWIADLLPGQNAGWRTTVDRPSFTRATVGLTATCAVLAAVPDIDLLFAGHRTITHSIGAVVLVGLTAAAIAARSGRPVVRITLMCAVAYASHVFLDWLAVDRTAPRGVQALWPLGHRWYISGWNLFRPTERRRIFTEAAMTQNAVAIGQEILIVAPFLAVAWLVRVKTFARFAAEMARRDHAPQ
jgi:inner membrane protein